MVSARKELEGTLTSLLRGLGTLQPRLALSWHEPDTKLEASISSDLPRTPCLVIVSSTLGAHRLLAIGKHRGSPLRRGIDDIITQLEHYPGRYPRVKIARFISHLLAIRAPAAYGKYRTKFVQVVYEIQVDAPYKRHYHGFDEYRTVKGVATVRHNYNKLLREPIPSSPKVFAGDNDSLLSDYYLYNQVHPHHIESQPPPMKDANTQRLLDEANLLGVEEGYDTISTVETLPIVEDEMS